MFEKVHFCIVGLDGDGCSASAATQTEVYSGGGARLSSLVSSDGLIPVGEGADEGSQRVPPVGSSVRTDYVGSLVLTNGVLTRTLVEGGYIDAAGSYVFLLPDHLGNVRTAAKADGTRVADYDYYPYGDTFTSSSVVTGQPYRFGGKELDVFGVYDFSARWYDPNVGRFNRIDPLADRYLNISPYLYCAGNPVNLVDPTGEDIWFVDAYGRSIYYKPYAALDAVMVFDGPTGIAQMTFEKGTLTAPTERHGGLVMNGRGDMRGLFEFLAQSTKVEWSLAEFDNQNMLGTSYGETKEHTVVNYIKDNPSSLLRFSHSHPSEPYASRSDHKIAKLYQQEGIIFDIYDVTNDLYHQYNQYETIYDPRLFEVQLGEISGVTAVR